MAEDVKKLEEVIYNISTFVPGISRTQLVKLTYLIDREFFKEKNKSLTGVKYQLYFYGPYSNKFEIALYRLKNELNIYEDFNGISYKIYPNKEIKNTNTEDEEEIINRVINFAIKNNLLKSAAAIKRYVYSLKEVDNAEPFTYINFTDID